MSIAARINLNNWFRITGLSASYADGLGTGPSVSRFCKHDCGYEVLYAANDFETAFNEVLIRDRFKNKKSRLIAESELRSRSVVTFKSTRALVLVDCRGAALQKVGIPTDATGARNHQAGRSLGKHCFDEPLYDGILFDSRLTKQPCVAIFDRSLSALLTLQRVDDLSKIAETWNVLRTFNISLA